MSATFLRLVKPLLKSDVADLATVDVWETRKFLTADEAVEARAYWHGTHPDPDPVTESDALDVKSDTPDVDQQ